MDARHDTIRGIKRQHLFVTAASVAGFLALSGAALGQTAGPAPAPAASDEWDDWGAPSAPSPAPGTAPGAAPGLKKHPVEEFWDWATETLQGHAAYRGFHHLEPRDEAGRELRRARNEAEMRLQYKRGLFGSVSLFAEVDLRYDDDELNDPIFQDPDANPERRPIVNWNDLYLLVALGQVDARLGFQTVGWGTADLSNPTDNVNPRDYVDFFDSRKIGVLAARLNYYVFDFNLEGIYVPFFVASRIPPQGKRFSTPPISLGALPVTLAFERERDFPDFPEESQVAARVSRSLGGWDLSASYYRGFNKIPVVRLTAKDAPPPAPGQPPVLTLRTELEYERIDVYGADFATTLGWAAGDDGPVGDILKKTLVHGEAAFVDSREATGDDYVQFVAGFNYTFNNVIADHDVTVLVDYIDEWEVRERRRTGAEDFAAGLSPPFQAAAAPLVPAIGGAIVDATKLIRQLRGSIAARITYKLSESIKLDLLGVATLRSKDAGYLRPQLTWDLTDNFQLAGAYDEFLGPEDTFFGRFHEDHRFFFQAKVSF